MQHEINLRFPINLCFPNKLEEFLVSTASKNFVFWLSLSISEVKLAFHSV